MSDVPIGVFLSGGLDSATVLVVHARRSTTGPHQDVLGRLRRRRRSTSSTRARVDGQALRDRPPRDGRSRRRSPTSCPALIDAFDEPFADSSAIPVYYLVALRARAREGRADRARAATRSSPATRPTSRRSSRAGTARAARRSLARRVIPASSTGCRCRTAASASTTRRSASCAARSARRGRRAPLVEGDLQRGREGRRSTRGAPNGIAADARASTRDAARGLPERRLAHAPPARSTRTSGLARRHADQGRPHDAWRTSLEARVPLLDHPLVEFMATRAEPPEAAGLHDQVPAPAGDAAIACRATVAARPEAGLQRADAGLAGRAICASFVRDTLSPERIAAGRHLPARRRHPAGRRAPATGGATTAATSGRSSSSSTGRGTSRTGRAARETRSPRRPANATVTG